MYTLKIQPEGGQLYELTHDYAEFRITDIEGLDPPMGSINVAQGLADGGAFNSARLEPRNIVITCVLRGNIDASRQNLYKIFPQKGKVTIYFSGYNRDLKTVGYVERPACSPFGFPETAQISVICPDPYWHSRTGVAQSFVVGDETVFDNVGDVAAGWTGTIEFSSDDPPGVTLDETETTLSGVYPYTRNLFTKPMDGSTPISFDPSTMRITELLVLGNDYTDSIDSAGMITKQDDIGGTNAENFLHIAMDSAVFPSGFYTVTYNIASVPGLAASNLRCRVWTSTQFMDWYQERAIIVNSDIDFPDMVVGTDYDENTDYCNVYLKKTNGEWYKPPAESYTIRIHQESLIPSNVVNVRFGYNLKAAGFTEGKLVVYHAMDSTDIRSTLVLKSQSLTRNVATGWDSNLVDSIPVGFDASKDVPYINGQRITAADIKECVILNGGTVEAYTIVYGSYAGSANFKYVYSLNSADIRSYTDDQIEAGLIGTDFTQDVVIWNNTTGEWLQFKDTRFQLGDVVEISTVEGELRAEIIERDGETVSISLLSDVYRNGYFWQFVPGENTVEITADSGGSYISAELSAEWSFVGV